MELINDTLDYRNNILDAGKGTSESKKIFDDVIQNSSYVISVYSTYL